jgi:hypothetical protein
MSEDEILGRNELRTVGELRRRLAEMGDPWEVQLNLSDDDPLPMPSRGGDSSPPITPDIYATIDDLRDALRAAPPPTNPFLQQEWSLAGLIEKDALHGIVGSPGNHTDMQPVGADAPSPVGGDAPSEDSSR